MIRRLFVVLVAVVVLALPAQATSLGVNVPITQVGVIGTVTLGGGFQFASYDVSIQCPTENSRIDYVYEVSYDGGVTWPFILSSTGFDGGWQGTRDAQGVLTIHVGTPATFHDAGVLSASLAGTIIRVRVINITGGTWTVVAVSVTG